jgi:hypothetical protein
MLAGYIVKVGLDEVSGEAADHFVAHQAMRVVDLQQVAPYCLRSPVGPASQTLPHTEYTGFGESPSEALEVALDTCRRDWPGIEIVHESALDRSRNNHAVPV